jgi:low temperature requirement protein LtrA
MRPRAHHIHPAGPAGELSRWTFGFRLIFVAFIVWASARTMVNAHSVSGGHSALALAVLGAVEIAGALLFMVRRTQLAGVIVLLLVFGAAAVMAVQLGQVPLGYFYYAATAAFIIAVDRRITYENAAGLEPGGAKS